MSPEVVLQICSEHKQNGDRNS